MRIRKNASKLLGVILPEYSSSYSPPRTDQRQSRQSQIWSPPPASCATVGSAAAWQACELNQSPWDVTEFPIPPAPFLPNDSQTFTLIEENGSVIAEHGIKFDREEFKASPVAAAATPSASYAGIPNANDHQGIDDGQQKINSCNLDGTRRKSQRKKKTNYSDMATGKEGEEAKAMTNPTLIPLVCRKSDGKKWKCKRLVSNHQHSFCDYHLDQVRHYHSNKNSNTSDQIVNTKPVVQELPPLQKINKLKKREVRNKVKETGTGNGSSFYYYAGFGPWSTKTRKMTNSTTCEATKQETTDHDKGNSVESSDDGAYQEHLDTQQKQAVEGKLSELEQNDGEDHEEQHESDCEIGIVLPCNKTNKGRRRRIKARSLKSLL